MPPTQVVDYNNEVDDIPGEYTSWDGGLTYQPDDNRHFQYGGEYYYLLPDEDINDLDTWKPDTMHGWHRTEADYQSWLLNNQMYQANQEFNRQMIEELQRRNEMQERWYAEERARLEAAQAEAAAEAAELKEKERRRVYLAGLGRKTTLLTGGGGLNNEAPVRKQKLGAV